MYDKYWREAYTSLVYYVIYREQSKIMMDWIFKIVTFHEKFEEGHVA